MTNIWTDRCAINNENTGQLAAAKSKQLLSAKQSATKKNVFGELNANVMPNSQFETPFKGAMPKPSAGLTGMWSATKPMSTMKGKSESKPNWTDVKKNRANRSVLKPSVAAETKTIAPNVFDDDFDVNFFDDIDFPKQCKDVTCNKPDVEIWSDMNVLQIIDNIEKVEKTEIETETDDNIVDYLDNLECIPPLFNNDFSLDIDVTDEFTVPLDFPRLTNLENNPDDGDADDIDDDIFRY